MHTLRFNRRRFLERAGLAALAAPMLANSSLAAESFALGPNASLQGRRSFPDDNAWNRDISKQTVDGNSNAIIESIGLTKGLHPDFGTVWQGAPSGIPYVVVDSKQPRVPVRFEYAAESDPGPYPIPPDAPIEGGPNAKGDRHVLVIERDTWKLYETFSSFAQDGGKSWKASSGAVFDLGSNQLRPAGWTSADAAGLPIFPGLVRYDEVMEQKAIRHALRFTVRRSRRAYVPPATHFASRLTDANLPPMGMRVRLKSTVDISKFPPPARVILAALQRYGMMVADNGGDWFLSGAPDPRWNDEEISTLKRIKGRDFEVVQMNNLVTR